MFDSSETSIRKPVVTASNKGREPPGEDMSGLQEWRIQFKMDRCRTSKTVFGTAKAYHICAYFSTQTLLAQTLCARLSISSKKVAETATVVSANWTISTTPTALLPPWTTAQQKDSRHRKRKAKEEQSHHVQCRSPKKLMHLKKNLLTPSPLS